MTTCHAYRVETGPFFCTRMTACHAYRVETGPYFVPGLQHGCCSLAGIRRWLNTPACGGHPPSSGFSTPATATEAPVSATLRAQSPDSDREYDLATDTHTLPSRSSDDCHDLRASTSPSPGVPSGRQLLIKGPHICEIGGGLGLLV